MSESNVYHLTLRPRDADATTGDLHFRVLRLVHEEGEVYGCMDGHGLTATVRTDSAGNRVINWIRPSTGMDESTHEVVGWKPERGVDDRGPIPFV